MNTKLTIANTFPGFHVFTSYPSLDVGYFKYPDKRLSGKSLAEVVKDLKKNYGKHEDVYVIGDRKFIPEGESGFDFGNDNCTCLCFGHPRDIEYQREKIYDFQGLFQLLYQAGYLTPLKSGRVGIPNHDVFEAFVQLSQKIYARSGLPVDFSDHTLRRLGLGLGHGDIFAFVRYMDEVYLQRSPVSSANLAESVYHLYIHALLAPLIGVGGFEIDHEGLAEGGRMDIRIRPVHDNKSTVRPYIVLELKQLSDDTNTKLGEAMSDRSLKSMSQKASIKCQEAMTQIRQRYQGVNNHRAKGSAMILQIGVTFWRYRFYLIAHRLSPTTNRAGEVLWVQKPFTAKEIAGHDTNNVKFTVDGGNLRASSIYKGE
ncbi:hypothetical protein GGH13_000088 [Coemansia sp. S155-1]|nr:hypothetical protein GGH13_000088 [Coemansia sp. S155-1]